MKQWMLACVVLTVAGLAASEATAQETIKVQPTPVIQSDVGPRSGPGRRGLGRREMIPSGPTVTRTETTTRVEQAPPIVVQPQPQVVETRRDGLLSRLRSRLGRS